MLVKPVIPYTEMDEVEKKGLIHIPEAVKQANTPLPSMGIVIQVGTGLKFHDLDGILYPGVGVMFSKYGGSDFVIDQVDYKILLVDEIMATFVVEDAELVQPIANSPHSES